MSISIKSKSRNLNERGHRSLIVKFKVPRLLPKSFTSVGALLLALILIFLLFSRLVSGGHFASPGNIELILIQSVIVLLTALGSAYVIISGGIDLSVGSATACSSVTVAVAIVNWHFSLPLAFAVGVVTGGLWGLLNGLLVTKLQVGPFIATLSTYLIVRAAARGIAHDSAVSGPDNNSWLNNLATSSGTHTWQLLPWGVWITIGLAILMGICLKYTRFGRYTVAVGSNENAAKLCGVPVNRVKLSVYILSGLFAGLAGVMLYSQLIEGDPTSAKGLELQAIAAVVIGGASLSGGEGSIAGAMIGALIMQTIETGSAQMGLPDWVQKVVTGVIILIAVGFDRFRAKRSNPTG